LTSKKIHNDWELVEMARQGDMNAFAEIVSRYEGKIARTVIGMLGDANEADDVGQETFIRFFKSIHSFRGDSSLGTYLTRIAINLSYNVLKKSKRTGSLVQIWDKEEKEMDIVDESQDHEEKEKGEMIDKAIQSLEPGFRAVVNLRLVQGYTTKETAEMLGLPLGTVLSRLSRAQMQLQCKLKHLI